MANSPHWSWLFLGFPLILVPVLKVYEVAEKLGWSTDRVVRAAISGALPAERHGRRWRFHEHVIDEFVCSGQAILHTQAVENLNSLAAEKMRSNPQLKRSEALAAVLREQPEIVDRYQHEKFEAIQQMNAARIARARRNT